MDSQKAKREERRRKILLNAEKRLEKISRCKLEDCNDVDIEEQLKERTRLFVGRNCVKNETPSATTDRITPSNENLCPPQFEQKVESDKSSTFLNTANIAKKLRTLWKQIGIKLILLAIVVRIVHSFKLGYLFGETIVVPFALFMMTQLSSCQFEENNMGITATAMCFLGIPPNRIKTLSVCYNAVTTILTYFAIYFLTFICAHFTIVQLFGV